eukprot:Seg675.36 transcript_id=Seg675.36/GoldUCD/mRNA.D3Y31 product="Coiled-coil domain-containing protein 15" protein_id=Seg675.36/GoldUCD/D3Y31
MKMADRADGYHLKKTCSNSDVTSNLKQIRKRDASIQQSKGFISSRSVHPSSFTAWIECFKSTTDEADEVSGGPAQIDAEEIQAKIDQIEKDRREKLKQFQQEVDKRVKLMRIKKQKEQMDKSIEEFDKESKVMYQNAFPKQIPTSQKNPCSFRSVITADKIKNIMTGESNLDTNHNIERVLRSVHEIDQKAEMIKNQTSQARAGLISKRLDANTIQLPGGIWGSKRTTNNNSVITDRSEEERQINPLGDISKECHREERRQRGGILNDMWKGFDVEENEKAKHNVENRGNKENEDDGGIRKEKDKEKRKIRFKLPEEDLQQDTRRGESFADQVREVQKRSNGNQAWISAGKDSQDSAKENSSQYWTYRKLFMGIEREKVRETQRRKRHKKVISRLKQEKESERDVIEKEVEVCLPIKLEEKKISEMKNEDVADQRRRERQNDTRNNSKQKEMNRYIKALRILIQEKASDTDKQLPSVCSCGNTLMETHPDTCANNCIFYKNPNEYARVLSAILSSLGT